MCDARTAVGGVTRTLECIWFYDHANPYQLTCISKRADKTPFLHYTSPLRFLLESSDVPLPLFLRKCQVFLFCGCINNIACFERSGQQLAVYRLIKVSKFKRKKTHRCSRLVLLLRRIYLLRGALSLLDLFHVLFGNIVVMSYACYNIRVSREAMFLLYSGSHAYINVLKNSCNELQDCTR